MKKIFIIALLALGLNGFAQEVSAWSIKKVQKMAVEMSLTAEQQKILLPLIEERRMLYEDIKANPGNKNANRFKIKEIGKKINAVLTPEQVDLYLINILDN